MAKLIFVSNISLDGYFADAHGDFDFTEPGDDVFAFITELIRPLATHLYGRRMYDTMAVWETDAALRDQSALYADFADAWRAATKIVFSTSLDAVYTERSTIERRFDPAAVQNLKEAATADLMIGGPTLAAEALAAGLLDEVHLFVYPVLVGAGKPALSGTRAELELVDERRFDSGAVYLRHRVTA